VLLLKIVQGIDLREVAEVAGVSLSTVNYRLNQALSLLASVCEGRESSEMVGQVKRNPFVVTP